MKLRFYAARDACVPQRDVNGDNLPAIMGSAMRYVGRSFDGQRGYPAAESAYECESDTGEGAYLRRECSRGDLIAADADTAAACGVQFVPHTFSEGVWAPQSDAPRKGAGKAS